VYWYAFSDGWKRHALALPDDIEGIAPDRVWNVRTMRFTPGRAGILTIVAESDGDSAMLYLALDDPASPFVLKTMDYNHPMEDRIILYDLDGDGVDEAFIPDSGTGSDRLFIFSFECR
jgi:hypothetical protein